MQPSRNRSSRRGITLAETAVALVVVSAAMVALVQFVGLAGRQRRLSQQRLVALMDVGNEAERLARLSWDETSAETLTTWQPSEALSAIPEPECRIHVSDEDGIPVSRRIDLRLTWKNVVGQNVQDVELSIWKFRPETSQ